MMHEREAKKVANFFSESVLAASKINKIGYAYQTPYVSTCAQKAKLLHYNGALKPWRRKTMKEDHPGRSGALCAGKASKPDAKLIKCADIWSSYLSQATEKAFQG